MSEILRRLAGVNMRLDHRFLMACIVGASLSGFASAQTATTGGTGGATGGTTGTTGGTGGGSTVSSSGGGGTASRAGANTGSGTGQSGPFAGTVSAGFSGGNAATTQTNMAGGTGGGAIGGTTNTVPTTNNPWRATYGNPYAIGQTVLGGSTSTGKGGAASKGFGQPLYTTTTTGIGTSTGLGQGSGYSGTGFNNANISKVPRYTSALSDDIPRVSHTPKQIQANVQNILARSTQLNGSQIGVYVEGDRVVLLGRVANERERRVAESMNRLTPGVGDVENRLALPGQP